MDKYTILAFYHYTEIKDPLFEVKKHHEFLKNYDVRARVYLSYNGINGQMSFLKDDALAYMDWLKKDEKFSQIEFKIDFYHEHIYPRVTVKFRKELVAMGHQPDLEQTGVHLSPEKWKEMLEKKEEDTLLIDVRNHYESEIGHFEGAERPKLKYFRDFPNYAESLVKKREPEKTKVMMYCTGGIRCEVYSALLKEKGFKEVYQLRGGVINYGHKIGNKHWKGKLFVFDDRLSVPISEEKHELISRCHSCQNLNDTYYNCANMDCNVLFLSCLSCAEKMKGCCSEECQKAKRRRPFEKRERPRPFRKWYNYLKSKTLKVENVTD